MRGAIARTVAVALALVLASVRQSAGDPIIHEGALALSVFAEDPLLYGVNGLAFAGDALYCSVSPIGSVEYGAILQASSEGSVRQVAPSIGYPYHSIGGVDVNWEGNVLVCNATAYGGNEVWKVTPSGSVSLLYSGLSSPTDLRLDEDGNILVVERFGIKGVSRIARNGSSRTVIVQADDYGWQGNPTGIEVNGLGTIFVAYRDTGNLYAVPAAGNPFVFAQVPSSNGEIHLAFAPDGTLFASNDQRGEIYRIAPSGSWSLFASGIGRPMGMAFDNQGAMYFAAQTESRIYEVAGVGVVPEPLSLAFMGSAFVGVVGSRLRARHRARRVHPPQCRQLGSVRSQRV